MDVESNPDSLTSTPRSFNHTTTTDNHLIRLMCSFGGKILPRPHDNQLRYIGGDTRIIAIHPPTTTFSSLLSKLSTLLPAHHHHHHQNNHHNLTIKYQLPNEDLDSLITVSTDEDLENMIDEFDRLSIQHTTKTPRLRLFIFPNNPEDEDDEHSRTSSIASLLDGSKKRENWFLDALNGGDTTTNNNNNDNKLERERSEVSSIVSSEVPDYLFGLESSDDPVPRLRNRVIFQDQTAGSDSGSPFGSTSSAGPTMPNLAPVKTKMENPVQEVTEPAAVQYTGGYSSAPIWNPNVNPGSSYPGHTNMQSNAIPVYYVPATVPAHVPPTQMQPVPVPGPGLGPGLGQYYQQYGGPGQVQMGVGYSGLGGGRVLRTVSGVDTSYEMMQQMQGGNTDSNNNVVVQTSGGSGQPVYYGVRNPIVGGYPGMVAEQMIGSHPDPNKSRSLPS